MDDRSSNSPAAPAPAPSSAPPAAPKKPAPPSTGENIKETIESILIAFILAFVFRAFIVEAFVIPTGSMAPTLLGAHLRNRCTDCGYQWEVNWAHPQAAGAEDPTVPKFTGPSPGPTVYSMRCPNCAHKVSRADSTNAPVFYGDRILVLKYLYFFEEPTRWDVVVFKSPGATERATEYATNFIKRLAGKPGEQLMVLDGDVYVRPLESENDADWRVQGKPRAAQDALWRIVYDNDYAPRNGPDRRRDKKAFRQPWVVRDGSGWVTAKGPEDLSRVFTFDNPSGAGTLAFDKDLNKNLGWYPLTDWLAYDETKDPVAPGRDMYQYEAYADGSPSQHVPKWNVSDLKLTFFHTRKAGDGALTARLTKLGHAFSAKVFPDRVELWSSAAGAPDAATKIGERKMAFKEGTAVRVDLINVDYRVVLRIDDRDVLWTTPEQYGPQLGSRADPGSADTLFGRYARQQDLGRAMTNALAVRDAFDPATVSIRAENQVAEVSHVSLWRDVYYTPGFTYHMPIRWGRPGDPIRLHRKGDKVKAAETDLRRDYTADDEYFVLGDNSILSSDARMWDRNDSLDLLSGEGLVSEAGRVPGRFMIGKAFFVYWPAGFRPFSNDMPGVVPNFGDMRFIH